jgi:hypothetical protein
LRMLRDYKWPRSNSGYRGYKNFTLRSWEKGGQKESERHPTPRTKQTGAEQHLILHFPTATTRQMYGIGYRTTGAVF